MTRTKTFLLDRKKGLYLKSAGKKGRGVFCTTAIRKGEVLEVTPAIVLDPRATDHADKTILTDYTFKIGKIAGLKNAGDASCVVMGLMSYCNHSEQPNAEIEWEEKGGGVYYTLHATRAIPKGVEICTSYGEGWFDDRK